MFTRMIFKSYSLSCKSLGLVRLNTLHPRRCLRAPRHTCSDHHATRAADPRPADGHRGPWHAPHARSKRFMAMDKCSGIIFNGAGEEAETQVSHEHKSWESSCSQSLPGTTPFAGKLKAEQRRREPGPHPGPWSPSSSKVLLLPAKTTAPCGPVCAEHSDQHLGTGVLRRRAVAPAVPKQAGICMWQLPHKTAPSTSEKKMGSVHLQKPTKTDFVKPKRC